MAQTQQRRLFVQQVLPHPSAEQPAGPAPVSVAAAGWAAPAMDALVSGWSDGRARKKLHFAPWKDDIDEPLGEPRRRVACAGALGGLDCERAYSLVLGCAAAKGRVSSVGDSD